MSESELPTCRYGAECYRQKNAKHMKEFIHPVSNSNGESEPTNPEVEHDSSPVKKKLRVDPIEKPPKAAKRLIVPDTEEEPPKKPITTSSSGPLIEVPPLKTLEDRKSFIQKSFLFEMPPDFYLLWSLASKLHSEEPQSAFSKAGLHLVGPFDILAGLFNNRSLPSEDFLVHWRYFFDQPEFQTVLRGEKDSFHIGYYRDDPKEPPIVVSSRLNKQGLPQLQILGDNLFSAILSVLEENAKECTALIEQVRSCAKENHFTLGPKSAKVSERKKRVVCQSFNGIGLVVPFENNVGYRELPETDANLKRILKKISDASDDPELFSKRLETLQEIITYVQFANDECDYGEGLELGIDLFLSGHTCFDPQIRHLLSVAYKLLKREEFAKIITAHLDKRRTGTELSVL